MEWEPLLKEASRTLIDGMKACYPSKFLGGYEAETSGKLDISGSPDWDVRLEAAGIVITGFNEALKARLEFAVKNAKDTETEETEDAT